MNKYMEILFSIYSYHAEYIENFSLCVAKFRGRLVVMNCAPGEVSIHERLDEAMTSRGVRHRRLGLETPGRTRVAELVRMRSISLTV